MKTTFIGVKMAQTPRAVALWEQVLSEIGFKRIIEFGSYKWGMSLLFFLFALKQGAEFYTYDIGKFTPPRVVRQVGVNKHFKMVDVFSIEKDIGELIKKDGITVIYCDGGDKQRELDTFSKYMKKGDYIAVHDWGTEATLAPRFLNEVFSKECDEEGMTRIFQYA